MLKLVTLCNSGDIESSLNILRVILLNENRIEYFIVHVLQCGAQMHVT